MPVPSKGVLCGFESRLGLPPAAHRTTDFRGYIRSGVNNIREVDRASHTGNAGRSLSTRRLVCSPGPRRDPQALDKSFPESLGDSLIKVVPKVARDEIAVLSKPIKAPMMNELPAPFFHMAKHSTPIMPIATSVISVEIIIMFPLRG